MRVIKIEVFDCGEADKAIGTKKGKVYMNLFLITFPGKDENTDLTLGL